MKFLIIFIFVFSILVIIRDTFQVIRVIKMREGKVDMPNKRVLLLGLSISYVLSILIMSL